MGDGDRGRTVGREGRRLGDGIAIDGAYQHRAVTSGPPIQRFWHHFKQELVHWLFRPRPGERVLDVGCGSGVFAERLAREGAEVLGVDGSEEAIRYAQATFARPGLSFVRGYLDELDLPRASFDRACCLEVIEHVYLPQAEKLLRDLRCILRPGGQLLVTTPNYRGTWPLVEWAADRFGNTATMDAEQHVTHFHRRRLRETLERAGFEVRVLRTYCTIAPFVAAVSWSTAEVVARLERSVDLPFGNLLVAVAVAPSSGHLP